MQKPVITILLLSGLLWNQESKACSVLYYIDSQTSKIYVVNNEDYWYDVDAYIRLVPARGNKLARLWYGWDGFAQGGINEAGLFFDGAVTPSLDIPGSGREAKGNLGDDILALCRTVEEALLLLEDRDIALNNAHMMLGDATGKAVVVEWLEDQRKVVSIADNRLIMTNFLLSDPSRGNYPCPRYQTIEKRLNELEASDQRIDLRSVGNVMSGAVQSPRVIDDERVGGTLYTTFINISDMEFVLVYQLDNTRITSLDLDEEFNIKRKRRIKMI